MNLMDTASLARQRPQSTGMDTAVFHTVTGTTGGDTVGNSKSLEWDEDDTLSIQPGQREKSQLLGDDDSDHSNSHSLIGDHCQDSDSDEWFMKYSSKTRDLLRDMFGQDAVTRPDKGDTGIILDKAQRDVLSETWRAEKPTKISAFKDTYRSVFPVSAEAEEFLYVPSLDNIILNLLIKRFEKERRKAAMADCGLNDSREVRNHIWNLPLTHEGICGSGLEQKLKERVEMNKQISDLLPEVDRKPKRKNSAPVDQPWKRTRFTETRLQPYRPYHQPYNVGTVRPQFHASASAKYTRFPKSSTAKSATPSRRSGELETYKH
ncbi:uncharacterized protein LOC127854419 [Dreissena polymorpha]|uniref:uncharacterized protein LOC127854419 n=1 Tax=Dreissena polymorpha TaxID=45954 RepID=UPI002263D7BD|nr:uncharacterized protein LOC127854419 [Dreissena polymorpha]